MAKQLKQSLRERANSAAAAIEVAGRNTIECVHECGLLLLEVKHALPHGEFLEFVEKEFKHGDRLARKYMTIAKSELRVVLDCNTIAEALRITSPKTTENAGKTTIQPATVADLTPEQQPSLPTSEQPESVDGIEYDDVPADDFADMEPAKAITKQEAVTVDQDRQKTLIQNWVSSFAEIESKLNAASKLFDVMDLKDLRLLAFALEQVIEAREETLVDAA